MDFGGLGFVRLYDAFRAHGHVVTWFSFGDQVRRLRTMGCNVENVPEVAQLALRPFSSPDDIGLYPDLHRRRVASLGLFLGKLKAHRPDLVVIDRLLVCGGLAVEQLDIPYIAIGTPGGYWRFDEIKTPNRVNVHPELEPINSYRQYGRSLKDDLCWTNGDLNSGWVRSPYCNLHFLGQSFYSGVVEKSSSNIYHHNPKNSESRGQSLGISFGNQGDITRLKYLAEKIINDGSMESDINIFVGGNKDLHSHFLKISHNKNVRVYDWVDFSVLLPDISCLVFLGGVGSIWHCIEQGIPMIAVPGYIGDQLENATRIDSLGIGIHLKDEDFQSNKILGVIDRVARGGFCDANISKFGARDNYSDTMASFSERVLRSNF